MYEYQKDPLYQSHVLSIEEIEEAHRRAKRLQSTAFVNAIQNLFESKTKTSVRPARNIPNAIAIEQRVCIITSTKQNWGNLIFNPDS